MTAALPEPLPAAVTRSTVYELLSDGWTIGQVGQAAGRPPEVIGLLALGFLHWISPSTAAAVSRAARQLAERARGGR